MRRWTFGARRVKSSGMRRVSLPAPPLALGAVLGACLLGALGCGEREPESLPLWTPSAHGQPQRADPNRVPAPAEPQQGGEARAAAALWRMSCARCHGPDGSGQGPERPPGAQMADFGDPAWQKQRSDEMLREVIREGRGLMPPFGERIGAEGIAALVRYIRELEDS